MPRLQKLYFASYIIIFLILLSLFDFLKVKAILSYTFIFVSASVVFIFICRQILKYDINEKLVLFILFLGIFLRLAFIPMHPTGSDDYYRYIWDGKVQASGINPYTYAPDAAALNSLHTEKLPKLVNYPEMKTIYPPLAEILFCISYLIGKDGFYGLKILLFISEMFTLFGLYLIIKRQNLKIKNILIYALTPLIFFQFFIDAHLDGFGLPFIIFSIFFYLDKKKILSYIFLGLSLCIKPLGLIIIPIFFFSENKIIERIKPVIIPLIICVLFYLPYTLTGSPFQSLVTFTENWTFNGVVFNILNSFINDNQIARSISAVLLIITYLPLIITKKRDFLTKIYISVFLLFIFSPVVHPWYVVWLAVLLPVIPRWSGILYISLISLTAFTVMHYQLTGVWKDYTIVQIFEYVPVIALFLWELFFSPHNHFYFNRRI